MTFQHLGDDQDLGRRQTAVIAEKYFNVSPGVATQERVSTHDQPRPGETHGVSVAKRAFFLKDPSRLHHRAEVIDQDTDLGGRQVRATVSVQQRRQRLAGFGANDTLDALLQMSARKVTRVRFVAPGTSALV